MKGLIAFSIISLLAGAQSFTSKAQAVFHSQAPFHSQGEIHESATAKLHDKEPWELEETVEATETPEASPTVTPTPTPTVVPSATPTPIESSTPTATPVETPEESPTASPTPTTGVNLGTGALQDLLNAIIKFFQSLGQ